MTDLIKAELPFTAFIAYETKKERFAGEEVEIRRVFEDANGSYVSFFTTRLDKEITIPRWNIWTISDENGFIYEHDDLFDRLEEPYDYEKEMLEEFERDLRDENPKTKSTKWGIGRFAKIIAAACTVAVGFFFELSEPSSIEERLLILLVAWITIYIPVWIAVWVARRVRRVFQRNHHSG